MTQRFILFTSILFLCATVIQGYYDDEDEEDGFFDGFLNSASEIFDKGVEKAKNAVDKVTEVASDAFGFFGHRPVPMQMCIKCCNNCTAVKECECPKRCKGLKAMAEALDAEDKKRRG